jgi:hypothetical protein
MRAAGALILLAGVEVVPVRTLRQVDAAFARAVGIDRGHQQVVAEQELVLDVLDLLILRIVHHQPAHDGARVVVGVRGGRVNVRHQAIAQLQVGQHRLAHFRAFRRDVVDLALDHFAVRTEQRAEGAELEPAQVQFLPFLLVEPMSPAW